MEHLSPTRNRSLLRAGKRMFAAMTRANRPLIWCVVCVICARAPASVGFTSPGKLVTGSVQGAGDCFYSKERRLPLSTTPGICRRSSNAHGGASKLGRSDHRPSLPLSRARRAPETPSSVEGSRHKPGGRLQHTPELPRDRLGYGGGTASNGIEGMKSRNVVNFYMNNLKQYRLLDASEEITLGRDIQKGVRCELVRDRLEARQGSVPTHEELAAALGVKTQQLLADLDAAKEAKRAMISANLRLVVSVAKRYRFKGIAFSDLIQEGTFGLVKASEKFDPELGFKFSTYATWWIKQSIMSSIGEQSRVIRLPVHVHTFLNSVRRSSTTMAVNGRDPSDDEIGKKLNTTAKKIQFYRNAAAMTSSISLDARIGGKLPAGKTPSSELSDVLGEGDSPEDLSHTADLRGKVMAMLETLDYREQKVVRARYGLDGFDPRTLEEIGREFDITRERVRQIESRAMSKLRQPYRNYRLRDHASGHQAGITGGFQSKQEAVDAAVAMIAEKESAIKACSSKSKRSSSSSSSRRRTGSGAVPYMHGGGGLGVSVGNKPPGVLPPEQRSWEIESKRRLLDKVWNQESEAMLHRLECELALSEQEALTPGV